MISHFILFGRPQTPGLTVAGDIFSSLCGVGCTRGSGWQSPFSMQPALSDSSSICVRCPNCRYYLQKNVGQQIDCNALLHWWHRRPYETMRHPALAGRATIHSVAWDAGCSVACFLKRSSHQIPFLLVCMLYDEAGSTDSIFSSCLCIRLCTFSSDPHHLAQPLACTFPIMGTKMLTCTTSFHSLCVPTPAGTDTTCFILQL